MWGLLLSLVIAGVVVRGIATTPGWVEYSADFSVNLTRTAELSNWASAWNGFTGDDNSATLSLAPIFLVPLQIFNSATTQKLVLFLVYFLIAAAAYFGLRSWLRDSGHTRGAGYWAGLGAFLYCVNPWVATESVHLFYLWLYALLPVTFHCVRKGLVATDHRSTLFWAMLAGAVAASTLTAYGIAFHGLLTIVLVLTHAVGKGRPLKITRLPAAAAAYVVSLLAVSSYWLFPILFGFRQSFQNGTSWALFTTKDLYFLSPFTAPPYAVRGVYRDVTAALASQSIGTVGVNLGMACGFALPLAAALAPFALAQRLKRAEYSLLFAAALFLLMANGTSPPIGDAYANLAAEPLIRQVAFVLLKGPYKLVPMLLFCLLFLSLRTLPVLWRDGSWKRAVASVFAFFLVIWSVTLGSPLLTGDLVGYMRPIQPPAGFMHSIRVMATIAGNTVGNRIVWLPFSTSGDPGYPSWIPQRKQLPLIDGQVPPLTTWVGPTPVSSRSVSWLGPAAGRVRDEFLVHIIQDDPTANLGALLTAMGCRFIVVQIDNGGSTSLAEALEGRSDLELVYHDQYVLMFASRTALQEFQPPAPSIVVGGLEPLADSSSRAAAGPAARPYILATDLPTQTGDQDAILKQSTEVFFGPGKRWADLVLDAWAGAGDILNVGELVQRTVPLSPWDKDFFESHLWIPFRLQALVGSIYDPAQSSAFLTSNQAASLTVPVRASKGPREVWVRVFSSPLSQSLTVSTPGGPSLTTSSYATTTLGWRWIQAIGLPPSTASISLNIAVQGDLSAIDQVAVLPLGSVESAIARTQATLGDAEIVSGGRWQALPAKSNSSNPGNADGRFLSVPSPGDYRVVIEAGNGTLPSTIVVDGKTARVSPVAPNWLASAPLRLSSDRSYVQAVSGTSLSTALLWRAQAGAQWAPRQLTVERSGLLGSASASDASATSNNGANRAYELNYYDSFSQGWVAQDVRPLLHYKVNGFVNGFLIPPGRANSVNLSFAPNRWVAIGRVVSLLTVVLVICLVAGAAIGPGRIARLYHRLRRRT